jgi:hypothetical protein
MDVADVPNGSYLLAVETGQGTVTEQVIIQH